MPAPVAGRSAREQDRGSVTLRPRTRTPQAPPQDRHKRPPVHQTVNPARNSGRPDPRSCCTQKKSHQDTPRKTGQDKTTLRSQIKSTTANHAEVLHGDFRGKPETGSGVNFGGDIGQLYFPPSLQIVELRRGFSVGRRLHASTAGRVQQGGDSLGSARMGLARVVDTGYAC